MSIDKVSDDELYNVGFDENDVELVRTGERIPPSLDEEEDVSALDGLPVFDGEKVIFKKD